MNEYCKNCLRHSWGSSPERKELEKIYNAKYYQANKNRWVINRQRRMGNIPVSTLTSAARPSGDTNDIIVAPFTLYDDAEDFNKSSKEGLKKIKKIANSILDIPPTVVSVGMTTALMASMIPKAIIESGKKFVDALKRTKVAQFLKESKEAYKKATSNSSYTNYDTPIGPTRKKK